MSKRLRFGTYVWLALFVKCGVDGFPLAEDEDSKMLQDMNRRTELFCMYRHLNMYAYVGRVDASEDMCLQPNVSGWMDGLGGAGKTSTVCKRPNKLCPTS